MIPLFTTIDLPIYAQIVLIYILIHLIRKTTSHSKSMWLFMGIIIALSFNNMIEILSWVFDGGRTTFAYYGNWAVKSIIFCLHSLPIITWAIYIDYQLFGRLEALKKRLWVYSLPLLASIGLVIVNFFYPIVFTIDSNNIYSRGGGAYLIISFSYMVVITMFVVSRKHKAMVDGRVLESVFWFTLIPLIGGTLQLLLYGIAIFWPSFILAILVTFGLVEKENMMRDPLTGLKTRAQFEERLAYKLRRKAPFGLIMMDMNHFKDINDTFGHIEGDEALQAVADMMVMETERQDLVCRYGGDEFIVLVETMAFKSLPSYIKKLDDRMKTYNRQSGKPYKLSISFGGVFVEENYNGSMQEILAKADERMYRDKIARKKRYIGNQKDGLVD